MNQKKLVWLLLFFLLFSSFPINNISVFADPPVQIYLITSGDDYKKYGFQDLGVYYTPNALVNFHMPFIVERKAGFINIEKNDLSHRITNLIGKLSNRTPVYDYQILDYNDDYFVIDFTMQLKASIEQISMDYIPKIKGVEFTQFAWWNSSWAYRIPITIESDYVSSSLVNIPIPVTINSTVGSMTDNGSSVRFVAADNLTVFAHEQDVFNTSSTSTFWVNVTSISSSSDTLFWLYYNNTEATSNENIVGVWDSSFSAVWHFTDTMDSKGNWNLTEVGTPDYQVGKIGNCVYLDGITEFLKTASNIGIGKNHTISAWLNTSKWGNLHIIGYSQYEYEMFFINTSKFFQYAKTAGCDPDMTIISGSLSIYEFYNDWKQVVVRRGYNWGNWFINGTDSTISFDLSCDSEMRIDEVGNFDDGDEVSGACWGGYLDEIWVSNVNRSSAWVEVVYHAQNGTPGFLIAGSPELGAGIVEAPTGFVVATTDATTIQLNWTKGTNATHTKVQRKIGSYPTTRYDGTNVFYNEGISYVDSDLDYGHRYYYSAWSYNTTQGNWSALSADGNNITAPANPTNIYTHVNTTKLQFTWSKGGNADTTMIRYTTTGTRPSSPTDGTLLINTTLSYYNDTGFATDRLYTMFSYNVTLNMFSTGIAGSWASLRINVYDENTSNAITYWDVFISNSQKTSTYESLQNNNTQVIDITDLPYGDNTMIKINATNYNFKIYYMDIELNQNYILNAYLSPINITESYIIRVINENDDPVVSATVHVMRYINDTVGYENVSIILTDGYGRCPAIQLVPNEDYAVRITATDYITAVYDLFPVPIVFEDDRYHIYTIYFSAEELPEGITEPTAISFTGIVNRTLQTISISFADIMLQTTNAQVFVYMYNYSNNVRTLVNSYYYNDSNYFNITVNNINNSNRYTIVLFYNHSYFGNIKKVLLFERIIIPATTQVSGDNLFDLNYGMNPIGWSNTFMWILAGFIFFGGGQQEAGFYMIAAGIILLFINYVIGFNTVLSTVAGGVIPILMIFIGAGMLWRDYRKMRGVSS